MNLDTTQVPTLAASSNTFSGSIAASSFTGSGAGLTGLSASNLSTGTVPSTALSGSYNIAISGNAASATTAANATNLGGNPPGFYAPASSLSSYLPLAGGTLTGALTASGGAVLPATGTATSGNPASSNPLDLIASSFSGGNAVNQKFRWKAEGNGSTNAGTLNLLYASGNGTPAETGLSIGNNGRITFASGQTFPGSGTITGVTAGTGLSGGGTSGTVTMNLDTTQVPTLAASSNTFSGSIAASSFTGSGAGLTSLNPANLSSGTANISISGNATMATTATTASNATQLGGVAASNYARLDQGNGFNGDQSVTGNISATGSVSGSSASLTGGLTGTTATFSSTVSAAGATLPTTGTATATAGFNSNPLDTHASSFNSGTSTAVDQLFRWQAEPVGNNTPSPSGKLNLLFGGGSTPAETGLSIASNGLISFASGQTFPGSGTITGVTAGTGLSGGGTSGTVTMNLDTTQVPTLAASSNTFAGSITASRFVGDGAAVTNVAAQTAATATNALNLGGLPANAYQLAGSYATGAAGTLGSLPKWTGPSTLGNFTHYRCRRHVDVFGTLHGTLLDDHRLEHAYGPVGKCRPELDLRHWSAYRCVRRRIALLEDRRRGGLDSIRLRRSGWNVDWKMIEHSSDE